MVKYPADDDVKRHAQYNGGNNNKFCERPPKSHTYDSLLNWSAIHSFVVGILFVETQFKSLFLSNHYFHLFCICWVVTYLLNIIKGLLLYIEHWERERERERERVLLICLFRENSANISWTFFCNISSIRWENNLVMRNDRSWIKTSICTDCNIS